MASEIIKIQCIEWYEVIIASHVKLVIKTYYLYMYLHKQLWQCPLYLSHLESVLQRMVFLQLLSPNGRYFSPVQNPKIQDGELNGMKNIIDISNDFLLNESCSTMALSFNEMLFEMTDIFLSFKVKKHVMTCF